MWNKFIKVGEYWDIELDFIQYFAAKILAIEEDADSSILQLEVTDGKGAVRTPVINGCYIIEANKTPETFIKAVWEGDAWKPAEVRKLREVREKGWEGLESEDDGDDAS